MIPAPTRSRLAKMIRMLGSSEMGEVLAAAVAMQTTLRSVGCDLHDLAAEVENGAAPFQAPRPRSEGGWDRTKRELALAALQWGWNNGRIKDPREREFVRSMMDRLTYRSHRSLTPAQERWVADIIERLKKPERTYDWGEVD